MWDRMGMMGGGVYDMQIGRCYFTVWDRMGSRMQKPTVTMHRLLLVPPSHGHIQPYCQYTYITLIGNGSVPSVGHSSLADT